MFLLYYKIEYRLEKIKKRVIMNSEYPKDFIAMWSCIAFIIYIFVHFKLMLN